MGKFEGEVDFTFEVATRTGQITPKQIWDNKDVWMKDMNDSLNRWNTLSDEKKAAIIQMVRAAMVRLSGRVEQWVPEGINQLGGVEGSDYMDIDIRLLFTDIDREIERNETDADS